jgi:hypothetical protein
MRPHREIEPLLWSGHKGSSGGRSRPHVYAIRDLSPSPHHLAGAFVDLFIGREDAGRFVEEVRSDEPELAKSLRIEERELRAGGSNLSRGAS